MLHVYIYKCQKETSCVTILNKNVIFKNFTILENRRVEQILLVGVCTSGEERRWGKGMGG
jgi:hypothetical protein